MLLNGGPLKMKKETTSKNLKHSETKLQKDNRLMKALMAALLKLSKNVASKK